jgi:general secretion pathway protein G
MLVRPVSPSAEFNAGHDGLVTSEASCDIMSAATAHPYAQSLGQAVNFGPDKAMSACTANHPQTAHADTQNGSGPPNLSPSRSWWPDLFTFMALKSCLLVPLAKRGSTVGHACVAHSLLLPTTTIAMNGKLVTRSAGFTLVELMIAIVIMGLLTAIALPIFSQYGNRVKTTEVVAFMTTTSLKLENYYAQYSSYPASLSEIGINEAVLDPWGNPYRYLAIDIKPPPNTGQVRRDKNMNPINTDYDLYSVGPDGRSQTQLMARFARDDIVRAGNGSYIGKAQDF